MNIVITGANGFVGKNLYYELLKDENLNVAKITRDTSVEDMKSLLVDADYVFHLAGVNRPKTEKEFTTGNVEFLERILQYVKENPKNPPIIFSSSIQAENDNAYGISKKAAEKMLIDFKKMNGNKIYIYQLPNLFGKWSKPNYNSVIATFCYKIARNEDISVNDPNAELTLNYIDDVIEDFQKIIHEELKQDEIYYSVPKEYKVTVGKIADLIKSYKEDRNTKSLPNLSDDFEKALYSTYLSYLPENEFSYPLTTHKDERGSFTEFLKTPDRGQVSINISKPGITKGNHWHHTKNEKFLVVSGSGVIRFRKLGSDEVIEYFVSDEKLEVVDIPVGYTHNIENLGDKDMVTVMWVNEVFDPNNPDTYFLEV